MSVDTYALTTTAKAKSYMHLSDADLYVDAITIYHGATSGATGATIQVTDTTIILTIAGGANAGATILTLTDAAYDTLSELVTAINALNKGWVANLIGEGSSNSGDLVIIAPTSCYTSTNILTLEQVDNYLIERLIDRASDVIESYCDRKFKSRTYTAEKYDGTSDTRLYLKNYPITSLSRIAIGEQDALAVTATPDCAWAVVENTASSVVLTIVGGLSAGTNTITHAAQTTIALMSAAIDAVSGWDCTVQNTTSLFPSSYLISLPGQRCDEGAAYLAVPDEPIDNYRYDSNIGIVYHAGGFGRGFQNIYVDYTAGYTTIPDDIEHICLELVATLYNQSGSSGGSGVTSSERIGDYSYTSGQTSGTETTITSLSTNAQMILDTYKRRVI